MAIAYDTSAGMTAGGASQAKTFNITVGAGSNTMMVIFSCGYGGAAANIANTLVKYNGGAATAIGSRAVDRYNNYLQIDAYYVLAPTSGTHAVTFTTGSAASNAWVAALTFSGCKQQSPTYATNFSNTSIKTLATSGMTYRSTDWEVDGFFVWPNGATTYTPQTGQTFRIEEATDRYLECSTKDVGAAGTGWDASANWQCAAMVTLNMEVYPSATLTGASLLMMLARQ